MKDEIWSTIKSVAKGLGHEEIAVEDREVAARMLNALETLTMEIKLLRNEMKKLPQRIADELFEDD